MRSGVNLRRNNFLNESVSPARRSPPSRQNQVRSNGQGSSRLRGPAGDAPLGGTFVGAYAQAVSPFARRFPCYAVDGGAKKSTGSSATIFHFFLSRSSRHFTIWRRRS